MRLRPSPAQASPHRNHHLPWLRPGHDVAPMAQGLMGAGVTEARDGVCPVCLTHWPVDSLAATCDHRGTPHASKETEERWAKMREGLDDAGNG